MELIWARAAGLIRRGWRATLVLALLAGLTAGVTMAMVAAGRRTATAYDRFFAYADVPELLINFCPPELEAGPDADLSACYEYDAIEEQRLLASLPEVEAAARGSFRGLTVTPVDRPDDRVMASTVVSYQDDFPGSLAGDYLVVDGRAAEAADEVLLNETLAERSGLGVGDRAVLTFWSPDELGTFDDEEPPELQRPAIEVEVVGIGRGLTDLAAAADRLRDRRGGRCLYSGPGLAAATADAGEFGGVLVQATDGDADAATAAIERAVAPQLFNVAAALGNDEIEPTRDAIRYEAQATTLLGLVLARPGDRLRRPDHRPAEPARVGRGSDAAGRRGHDRTGDGIGRPAQPQPSRVPAAALGVATAIVLSPRGPVGVGRRAEVDPGIQVDTAVLALGALAVLVVGMLGRVRAPGARARPAHGRSAPPRRRPHRSLALPPVATAGST